MTNPYNDNNESSNITISNNISNPGASQTISQVYNLLKSSNDVIWNGSNLIIKAPTGLTSISSINFRSFEGSLLPYTSLSLPELNIQLKVFMSNGFGEDDYVVLRGCDNTENIKIFNKIDNENYKDTSNIITEFNKAWTYDSSYNSQIEYNLKELVNYLNTCLSNWLGSTSFVIFYGNANNEFIESNDLLSRYQLVSKDICKGSYPVYLDADTKNLFHIAYGKTDGYIGYENAVLYAIVSSSYSLNYVCCSYGRNCCMSFTNQDTETVFIGNYDVMTKDNLISLSSLNISSIRSNKNPSILHAIIMPLNMLTLTSLEVFMNDLYLQSDKSITKSVNIIFFFDNTRIATTVELRPLITAKFEQTYDIRILDIALGYSTSYIYIWILYAHTSLAGSNTVQINAIRLSFTYTSSTVTYSSYQHFSDESIEISLDRFKAMQLDQRMIESSASYYTSSRYFSNGRFIIDIDDKIFTKQICINSYDCFSDINEKSFVVNCDEWNGEGTYNGRLGWMLQSNLYTAFYCSNATKYNCYYINETERAYHTVFSEYNHDNDIIHILYARPNNVLAKYDTINNKVYVNNTVRQYIYKDFDCYAMVSSSKTYPVNTQSSHITSAQKLFDYTIDNEASYITFPSIVFDATKYITFIPCIKTNPLYFNMTFNIPSSITINSTSFDFTNSEVILNSVNEHVYKTLELLILLQYEYNDLMFRCYNFPNSDNIVFAINEIARVSFKTVNINATGIELNCALVDSNNEAVEIETIKKLYGKLVVNIDWVS